MARYEDAVWAMTELLRFTDSSMGKRFIEVYEDSMRESVYNGDNFHQLPRGIVSQLMRQTLTQADPIYVSPTITEMIAYARESFEPEPVLPTDMFTACGFAYLPKPLGIAASKHPGQEIPVRAVGWVPVENPQLPGVGGAWIMYWSHKDDPTPEAGEMNEEERKLLNSVPFGSLQLCSCFWVPYNSRGWEGIPEGQFRDANISQWTLAQVLWRIGSQVVRTINRPQRSARREAKRFGVRGDDVTVIQLRKASEVVSGGDVDAGESEGGHLTVQFIVRGHWRNQPYGSAGEKVHRQIWISPYVKGPEDAPFHKTTRVFELVR